MSQEKVDKYKEEKKNRAKTIKKNKVKKALGICLACLLAGAAIGVPIGKFAYNRHQAEIKRNATIPAGDFENWFNKYYVGNYSDLFQGFSTTDATGTDASASDASASDAETLPVTDTEAE